MTPRRSWGLTILGGIVALVVFLADRVSKEAVLHGLGFINCPPCESIEILPFFSFTMVWNRGISYGLFPADSPLEVILLAAFAIVMIIILAWWLTRAENRWLAWGLGLVIGGAVGNAVDRFLYGAVADFFHLHAFGYSWYVFNVADAAIVFGVIAILIDALFVGRSQTPPALKGMHDDAR